jgi:hypothetical protein
MKIQQKQSLQSKWNKYSNGKKLFATMKHYNQKSYGNYSHNPYEAAAYGARRVEHFQMLIFFFKESDCIPSVRVEREKVIQNESTTIYDFPGYVALSMVYKEPDIVARVSPHLQSISTSTWGATGFGSRKCTKSIGFNNYAGKRDTNMLVQSVLWVLPNLICFEMIYPQLIQNFSSIS